jgi:plastocyanin
VAAEAAAGKVAPLDDPGRSIRVDLSRRFCGICAVEHVRPARRGAESAPVNLPSHRFVVVLLGLALAASTARAAELSVDVLDMAGRPARNVVVIATPKTPLPAAARSAAMVEMDQIDRQFSPYVLAVHTGTRVLFVNNDSIAHQVYSFSPVKRFELALYHGTPREPVVFDRPGVVTIGCNIHDNMLGYLYVTDAPWFGTTDGKGHWRAAEVPAGEYEVQVWSPLLPPQDATLTQQIVIGAAPTRASFKLTHALRPEPAPIKDKRVRDY